MRMQALHRWISHARRGTVAAGLLTALSWGLAVLAPPALAADATAAPGTPANAAASDIPPNAQTETPPGSVWESAKKAAVIGPADIALLDEAVLKLPAQHIYIPQPHAAQLMRAMGNPGEDTRLQGLIFPPGGPERWLMTVRFDKSGYIKDDDAKDWNADDLLKSYREGTDSANEERLKMGVPALEILGWAERPAYDASSHRLVWAMSSREKQAEGAPVPPAEDLGVNYNTYLLGRDGYFSLNLVTGLKDLPDHKPEAQQMLQALNFAEGKRYSDFNASTDHMAEFGLAALVLGVGAKKLGLLAMAGVFLAKFAKVILLGVLGLGALLRKVFGGQKAAPASEPATVAATASAPAATAAPAPVAPVAPVAQVALEASSTAPETADPAVSASAPAAVRAADSAADPASAPQPETASAASAEAGNPQMATQASAPQARR